MTGLWIIFEVIESKLWLYYIGWKYDFMSCLVQFSCCRSGILLELDKRDERKLLTRTEKKRKRILRSGAKEYRLGFISLCMRFKTFKTRVFM